MSSKSIPRGFWPILAAIAVLWVGAPAAAGSSATFPGPGWTEAPRYVAAFAPRLNQSAYRAWVSSQTIDRARRQLQPDVRPGTGTSWEPRPTNPFDAFGQSGRYNRWALARLYGGESPTVSRGVQIEDATTTAAWLLVSPYPDPELTRLERGTLLLVLDLEAR